MRDSMRDVIIKFVICEKFLKCISMLRYEDSHTFPHIPTKFPHDRCCDTKTPAHSHKIPTHSHKIPAHSHKIPAHSRRNRHKRVIIFVYHLTGMPVLKRGSLLDVPQIARHPGHWLCELRFARWYARCDMPICDMREILKGYIDASICSVRVVRDAIILYASVREI